MSRKNPLEILKLLFQDQPNVLKMLNLRELDESNLADKQLTEELKKRELYLEPVNLYATGRTRAGKTSLGNCLLNSKPLISHGHQDCTDVVQYFRMASNLRYYDLPGAGSNENYENINRAALLIKQLPPDEDEDERIPPINEFALRDFSKYHITKKYEEEIIEVATWQSEENQKWVESDIILYIIAPHEGFSRDDRKYLRGLMKSLKKRGKTNKVIFALNIHCNQDGTLKPTQQNIQDVYKNISEIFSTFDPNSNPLIVEINSLKGNGINEITKVMCQILPENKIGNMGAVLQDELREVAKKERRLRYRQTLVCIASRLATYKVDQNLGEKSILSKAYEAVFSYAIKVFMEDNAYVEYEKAIYNAVDKYVSETQALRQEQVKKKIKDVEKKEIEVEKIVGYEPEFQDVTITDQVLTFESQTKKKKRSKLYRGILGFTEAVSQVAVAPISIIQGIGNVCGVTEENVCKEVHKSFNDDAYEEVEVFIPRTKEVTRNEQRLVNIKERKAKVMEMVYNVVEKEQVVGKNYLQGGYPVVENLLAIGLGIEKAESSKGLLEVSAQ